MVNVRVGDVLKAENAKSGNGQNGKWVLYKVNSEKGYDEIAVWASNADKVDPSKNGKVKTILEVKKSARKYEKDGETKWADVYSVQAEIEQFSQKEEQKNFSALDDDYPF